VVEDGPHPYDFAAGARGVRLAEQGLLSSATGRRIDLRPTAVDDAELDAMLDAQGRA
jgi:hypothetical protein